MYSEYSVFRYLKKNSLLFGKENKSIIRKLSLQSLVQLMKIYKAKCV